jgi:dihydrofolate synthase/folylpolyglutamate synthase
MLYSDATNWLFNQFPSYQSIGAKAYKPDLHNITHICSVLNISVDQIPKIHVAGTNGKGSTCTMLSSIFMEAGYKTGIFTSPHINDFRERIAVNNNLIHEENVISFVKLIQSIEWSTKPSFFEISFALALFHFNAENCDVCIIETGLGGRLDATNIISPILSIITNISLDHTDILGDTVEEIAFEKAGIIKKNTPVIIGEFQENTYPVFLQKAKEVNSTIYNTWDIEISDNQLFFQTNYQIKNEKTVRTAIPLLINQGFNISEQNIENGIKNLSINTSFKGRLQIISNHPTVILDVAHNEAGINELIQHLNMNEGGQLHIIYGASSDKKIDSILTLFPVNSNIYFCSFSNERSFTLELFKKTVNNKYPIKNYFPSIKEAYEHLFQAVNKEDTILITGSFFLISDFFKFFSA